MPCARRKTQRGGRAGYVERLLDGEGHAGKRPGGFATRAGRVCGGGGARPVEQRHHQRIQSRIDSLDADDVRLNDFGCGKCACGDLPGDLRGA